MLCVATVLSLLFCFCLSFVFDVEAFFFSFQFILLVCFHFEFLHRLILLESLLLSRSIDNRHYGISTRERTSLFDSISIHFIPLIVYRTSLDPNFRPEESMPMPPPRRTHRGGGLLFSSPVSIVTRPMRRPYLVSMDTKGYIIQY